MKKVALVLSASAALAAAACGYNPIASSTTTKSPPPARGIPTPSGTVVRIYQGEFFPGHLIVIVGHAVQWLNFDPVGRQVRATAGARFSSGELHQGQRFSWTPHRVGRVRYRDPAHPGVVGTIVVVS